VLLAALVMAAACSQQEGDMRVSAENSACSDDYGPALDNWVASMDDNQDGVINSDEFNTAFEEAEDIVDGKLDRTELQQTVCGSASR
jgi:hypothetical protein